VEIFRAFCEKYYPSLYVPVSHSESLIRIKQRKAMSFEAALAAKVSLFFFFYGDLSAFFCF
jgi:hypothetical protein